MGTRFGGYPMVCQHAPYAGRQACREPVLSPLTARDSREFTESGGLWNAAIHLTPAIRLRRNDRERRA